MYLYIFLFIYHVYSLPQDTSDQIIHIHLIPHSHNDAGWIYTFKEYYDGLDPRFCTKCELDTILSAMQVEKTRTFSWSEISFFKLWYEGLSDDSKVIVKELIREKRLEFVGGSWVMNDEATVHYQNTIDQIRLGLLWLKEEFNVHVKTAWFLDTFGHSISNAAILAKMGYENLVFARIDWREKYKRFNDKSLEFFWRPFYSLDKGKTMLFTHVLIEHYNPPMKSGLRDIMYEPFYGNAEGLAKMLLDWAQETNNYFLTNHRVILFGDDFTFSKANITYHNIELLMKEVNLNHKFNSKIKLFYSTTENYFNSLRQSSSVFPSFNDNDFFPYSDFGNMYWTGFFTSRPFLKGLVVDSGKYLNTVNRMYLEDLLDRKINNRTNDKLIDDNQIFSRIMQLRENLGISQHHDAVTGTAREDVAIDYIERLSNSLNITNLSLKAILNDLLNNQIPGMINIENLIDVCFILGKDCRKNIDKFNKDSLNLYIIFNPGVNDTLHLKLNVSFLNFEVFEFDSEGERKIKFDNICTYIHDNTNYKYCTAFIDLEFKKDKLFTILMMKKVDKDIVVQRKSLISELIVDQTKLENEKTIKELNNNSNGSARSNDIMEQDINLVSFKKDIKENCLLNITSNPGIFKINERYYSTQDTATFFIWRVLENNFNLNLAYLKDCKGYRVVNINNIHYFSFNESVQVIIDSKGHFQTLSDLNHFKHENNTNKTNYYYYDILVYNDSTYSISFNLNEHFLIYNKQDNTNLTVKLHHCVISNDNSKNNVFSGAYILSTPEPFRIEPLSFIVEDSFIFEGDIMKEIHLGTQFSTIKIRIYNSSQNMFEIESVLDPNYIYNDFELMLLIQTNLNNTVCLDKKNLTEFWTDSNSMKMVRRVENHRFGWNISDFNPKNDNFSANFYPVNSFFALKNNSYKVRHYNESVSDYNFLNMNDSILTVFNDRSQGFTSHKSGEILVSLTRFSSQDDRKGLGRGISEYHSQYSFLHLTHIITFNTLETKSFIEQIIKKPVIFSLDLDSNLSPNIVQEFYKEMKNASSKRSIIEQLIEKDDCLEMSISIVSERKFILQFFNKNDYFFHKHEKGNLSFSEKFYENFIIKETSLNGINIYEKYIDIQRMNLRKVVETIPAFFSIDPQDFKTFLVEFK